VTHAELVTVAARWLRSTQGCTPVFAEMVTAAGTTGEREALDAALAALR